MLSWIPTLPFHLPHPARKKRLARPIKISAPIRRPSGSMHLRSSSFGESPRQGVTVDPRALNDVPDKPANGRTSVRKRLPPQNALSEIEEYPPQASTSKAAEMAQPTISKRPSLAFRTTTPLKGLSHGDPARQTSPKPRFDPIKPLRTSIHGSNRGAHDEDLETPRRWKGKEREIVIGEGEEESRENRIAAKAKEIRKWLRAKSGLEIHRPTTFSGGKRKNLNGETSYADKTRQTVNGVQDMFKKKKTKDRGPKAGQAYEIVQMRIIENNPEKTVEISTWREQAPGKESNTKEDDDRMSVYFIGADQYPQEGEFATEMSPQIEWRAEGMDILSPPSAPTKPNSRVEGVSYRKPSTRRGESPKIERRETGKSNGRRRPEVEDLKTPTSIASKEKSISASTSERDAAVPSSSMNRRPSNNDSPFGEHGIAPGSSTPKENQGTASRMMRHKSQNHGHKNGNGNGHYKDPKRVEKDLPQAPAPGPFRPTQSRGSTISSIKSESTTEFEAVLRSCEPSLLHIAPILRGLGIRRMEHLRAVAKLTPTTRDREVKEDALRMGITVMEWAIFVDRMFAL